MNSDVGQKKISIIIPVYNEAESVAALHAEIVGVMKNLPNPYEVIFIDDGSTDGTFNALRVLSPVKIIRFRKNFGQTAAMAAGFDYAQGEVIVTLDGDRQNDGEGSVSYKDMRSARYNPA